MRFGDSSSSIIFRLFFPSPTLFWAFSFATLVPRGFSFPRTFDGHAQATQHEFSHTRRALCMMDKNMFEHPAERENREENASLRRCHRHKKRSSFRREGSTWVVEWLSRVYDIVRDIIWSLFVLVVYLDFPILSNVAYTFVGIIGAVGKD